MFDLVLNTQQFTAPIVWLENATIAGIVDALRGIFNNGIMMSSLDIRLPFHDLNSYLINQRGYHLAASWRTKDGVYCEAWIVAPRKPAVWLVYKDGLGDTGHNPLRVFSGANNPASVYVQIAKFDQYVTDMTVKPSGLLIIRTTDGKVWYAAEYRELNA